MNLFQELTQRISRLAGNNYLYFPDALEIKTSPHSAPFRAWGVCLSPDNKVYVMDFLQEWFEVRERDIKMSASLLQRVIYLENKIKKS